LLQLVAVLVGVSFITYVVLNLLPGDPALGTLGEDATPEALAAFRREHGLDRPMLVRYFEWAGRAATGDLGESYNTGRPVRVAITERLWVTAELVVIAQVLALGAAIPSALMAVRRPNGLIDRATNFLVFAGLSIPTFLLSYVLILFFAVRFQIFPATGFDRIGDGLRDNLRSVALPAITLAVGPFAVYVRVLRSEMLDTLRNDFVTTAYGKGLSKNRVLFRHVFRGSLLSLVTVVGVTVGALLGGTVITESIFAIPGIGRLLIEAISTRDLMVVQGVVLFVSVCYVVINFLVDLLYSVLDPRIRYDDQHD
jgi:peptide/nickel transport system permease protein